MSDIMPNGNTPKQNWTDDDYDIFAKWIRGVLHSNKTTIVFTKKDGTERTMKCTLDSKLIPDKIITEDAPLPKERKKDKDPVNVRVFDTEKQEWRAFNAKSVKSVQFTFGDDQKSNVVKDDNWPFPSGKKP